MTWWPIKQTKYVFSLWNGARQWSDRVHAAKAKRQGKKSSFENMNLDQLFSLSTLSFRNNSSVKRNAKRRKSNTLETHRYTRRRLKCTHIDQQGNAIGIRYYFVYSADSLYKYIYKEDFGTSSNNKSHSKHFTYGRGWLWLIEHVAMYVRQTHAHCERKISTAKYL